MRYAAIALIPVFASFLFAQDQIRTETTTTWSGTLVDAACQSRHTERKETSRETNPDRSITTRSETTHTETVDCPVTATTSAFGLLTSDGRFILFDDLSNTRVIEIVKGNQALNTHLVQQTPLRVRVIGTANGDVAVVESLRPEGSSSVTVREASRTVDHGPTEVLFDVRYHDDHGKLVVTANGVNFEDVSDAEHSRSWSYAQIKELKREGGNEIKIETHSGDSFEFHVDGPGMSDTVYKTLEDRIVAARGR